MTDKERTLAALRKVGSRGITVRDFDPGKDGHVIDGGSAFTRTHARILDLRKDGYQITTVPGKPYSRYVLTGYPPVRDRTIVDLGGGWTRTHYCRRCDFVGTRPCGPVCPTCERPAVATVNFDGRYVQVSNEEREAA